MIQRHNQILELLNKEKEISVNRFSELLKVSLVTIRSDLRTLEDQKLLLRTHGGATLPPIDDISHRLSKNFSVKQRIAQAAANEVEEGETILLESGSSVSLMAQALSDRKNLNIITNNAFVARQLKDSPNVNVILMGGMFQKESETMVGPMVVNYLQYYNFSKVFLGMDGFTEEGGVMCRDFDRAEVMSLFVEKGKKIYVLSDSEKIGKTAVRSICRAEDVDCLITDDKICDEYRAYFNKIRTELIEV